ncbi:MAG: phage major capsid protein, P2 family [Motiliproteus sp.]
MARNSRPMNPSTLQAYAGLQQTMASAYGVIDVTQTFAATTPMETRLKDAVQASSDFLTMINMEFVTDSVGEALGMAIANTLAGRTDTTGAGERTPTQAGAPDGPQYSVAQTDFDVAMKYSLMDAWARYPNFMNRYMQHVYRRIALDQILVGWNGNSVAATTDRGTYPLLDDVNIGWLKLLEDNNPTNFMTEGGVTDVISIGAAGDYKNLDGLVYDVYSGIGVPHRSGSEVAIVGEALVTDDMGKIYTAQSQNPNEKPKIKVMDKSYGGLTTLLVPGFPDMGVAVTDLKNLSIYTQDGTVRRTAKDNAPKNQVEDFISMNQAYMVEDMKGFAAIKADNVIFKEA